MIWVKFEEDSPEYPNIKSSWEVDIDHNSRASGKKPVSVPYGLHYVFVEGLGYYKFHNKATKWWEAKRICEKEGTHLVIINSQEEVEVLKELRLRLPMLFGGKDWRDDTVYVGINDIEVENSWVTIFGQPLGETGFLEWDVNMPNKGRAGNCGCFRPSTGKLHDLGCEAEIGFYCELEL